MAKPIYNITPEAGFPTGGWGQKNYGGSRNAPPITQEQANKWLPYINQASPWNTYMPYGYAPATQSIQRGSSYWDQTSLDPVANAAIDYMTQWNQLRNEAPVQVAMRDVPVGPRGLLRDPVVRRRGEEYEINVADIGQNMANLLPSAAAQYTPEQLAYMQSAGYLDQLEQGVMREVPGAYRNVRLSENLGYGLQNADQYAFAVPQGGQIAPHDPNSAAWGRPASAIPVLLEDYGQFPGTPAYFDKNYQFSELRAQLRRMFEAARQFAPGGGTVQNRRTAEQDKQYQQMMTDMLEWRPTTYGEAPQETTSDTQFLRPATDPKNTSEWVLAGINQKWGSEAAQEAMTKAWEAWKPTLSKMFLPSTAKGGGYLPAAQASTANLYDAPTRHRLWAPPSTPAQSTSSGFKFTPRWG